MANWNKQYEDASAKSDIMRTLGFATLKCCDDINDFDREDITNNLEKLVNSQIELERRNAGIQRSKGINIGIWLGGAASLTGMFIGAIVKNKLNKK